MIIARKQTLVQLTDELVEALDRRAAEEKKSRSAVIREAVEQHLHDEVEAEKVRRYVEAYERTPQTDDELEWGRRSADRVLRRLDAEEPW
jgi:metal-responsive CopG/Arc/MetJ family transcriptional regulator